ncbi:GlxA family transcriptional regulator [Qingshengfaniella alkalisoli]|uniref:GlxA family transcriptional regulator n=1 Tax=Qingshengfaniella alkalisoli TaxID=2599296 RepID=A0A5B8I984_9RHOB|nr:GlxA family transcriptional regulator [Qingshengfaniella alkalisoli]QDY70775.1 GlxA family transcriptional regulator [Qingshengfaniella alkalisoli]
MTPAPRLRIGFILAPNFTLSAFANFVDVLRLAADEGDRSRPIHCRWTVLSHTGRAIRSSCGVSVTPDTDHANPGDFDYVVVVGGLIDDKARLAKSEIAFLKECAKAGIPLVGICTGAFILYRAGLMQDRKCCVSWFHHNDFMDQFEGLQPISDRIFVVDRDRLTSSGGASAAHLAAFLVDRHLGRSAARKSLNIMIVDGRAEGDAPQPGPPMIFETRDPLLRRALAMMQDNLGAPLSIEAIARRLDVSRRSLERRFKAQIGVTPAQASVEIRLTHATYMLDHSDASVAKIADATGFCDASHLTSVFHDARGITPAKWRRGDRRET